MRTKRIGSLEVSAIGLGCNNFGERIDAVRARAVVSAALDAGVTFFDTADVYGGSASEAILGEALGNRRDEVVLATKFGNPVEGQGRGAHPAYIRIALEASLRRLRTDRIDLYQLHSFDPDTPLSDTLGALDELVIAGMVREIGCCSFTRAQLAAADAACAPGGTRFVSLQTRYSLLHRAPETDLVPFLAARDMTLVPFFPLDAGLLSGKYRRGEPPPPGTRLAGAAGSGNRFTGFLDDDKLAVVERLGAFAAREGRSILELALGWLAAQRVVATVHPGATSPDQVVENVAAIGWRLTTEQLEEIDRIAPGPARDA